jgi:hypothetical protein
MDLNRRSFTTVPSKRAADGAELRPRQRQFTTIDLNVKAGVYRVQPYVRGPVSWTEFGEPTVLASEEFDSKIVAAVLDNLEKFDKAVFDQALAHKRTPAEQRKSVKQNLSVFVARLETNEIKISPQHRERGGYVGDEKNSTVLSPEDVPAKLAGAIRAAFDLAT